MKLSAIISNNASPPSQEDSPIVFKAGLLAYGSSYSLRLPTPSIMSSDFIEAFVADYSCGAAPDSHRLPFQGLIGLLELKSVLLLQVKNVNRNLLSLIPNGLHIFCVEIGCSLPSFNLRIKP